jgi:pSer/pThr/pTyr-binding forkhead associated (FHA) protein
VAADKGTHPPVQLDRSVCIVGRRGSAHLPLSAPQVSKVHALIVRDDVSGRVYVRDLASTNGVEVNGAKDQRVGPGRPGRRAHRRVHAAVRSRGSASSNGTTDDALRRRRRITVEGQSIAFPRGKHTLLIGQRASCDVRLEDASVAPVHAILFEMDGRHYVRAFEAPGGTKLNGSAVGAERSCRRGRDRASDGFRSTTSAPKRRRGVEAEESRVTPVADESLSGR